MTREAFLEALVQRVEAAWGDMDAPVSLADAFSVLRLLRQLGRDVFPPEFLTSEWPADTAEPADDEPTLF